MDQLDDALVAARRVTGALHQSVVAAMRKPAPKVCEVLVAFLVALSGTILFAPSPATMTISLYYIRHGQSAWNAEQDLWRAKGTSEARVKEIGQNERFADSPLSPKGVGQGLALRGRLFGKQQGDAKHSNPLGKLVRCVKRRKCDPPAMFVSNLRRAIDTALLALRPMLEVHRNASVRVLPALQETCHYMDCDALPPQLLEVGNGVGIHPPAASGAASGEIADDASLVERVTSLQGSALDEAATSSDAAFVRAAYNRDGDGRLHLGEIRAADAYHDRRRLENGKRLVDVVKATTDPVEFERLMGPLAGRMGDLVTTWLAAATSSQSGRGSSRPIVTTAHSRLLREILFMFRINQLSILAPRASGRRKRIKYDLRWKPATDAADCLALSTDEGKLSNCGVVSMDIEVCDSCARPTLTLVGCAIGTGSKVVPRTPKSKLPTGVGKEREGEEGTAKHASSATWTRLMGGAILIAIGSGFAKGFYERWTRIRTLGR